ASHDDLGMTRRDLLAVATFAVLVYPSYAIGRILVDGRWSPAGWSAGRNLWRAWVAGLVMTAWDLVMDPYMTQAQGWIWEQGGAYLGVPRRSFAGWMLTTVTIYSLYGWWEQHRSRRVAAAEAPWWLDGLPLLAYAALVVRYSLDVRRGALSVVAFFAMGLPCWVALGRYWDRRRSQSLSGPGASR